MPKQPKVTALPGARRTAPDVVSRNLVNNTELTLMMPVKPGFIPTRDTVTYATRARLTMEAFHGFRQIAREASMQHPFSDVVERIATIQSYRLSLLENDTKLLLAVSFDQPWEPYIRRIWRDTGPFLDAIICNCVDYDQYASPNGFEAFSRWVRKTQVPADFFYIADNLTVDDRNYLDLMEQRQREGLASNRELDIARMRLPDLEDKAEAERNRDLPEAIAMGLRALGVLYRLNDLFPNVEGSKDHEYFHHATRRLLHGFDSQLVQGRQREVLFRAELAWFEQEIKPPRKPRTRKRPGAGVIQGGILEPYREVSHGVLLLMRIRNLSDACRFIAELPVTAAGREPDKRTPRYNVGFTYNGLVQLQADPADLADLPQEFKEGMAARAGMLGDVRTNHPDNWNLPDRLGERADNVAKVEMSSVDFVIQIRCSRRGSDYVGEWGPAHPLYATVQQLARDTGWSGVQLLAIQAMGHQRDTYKRTEHKIREHFGFIDGISQPDIKENPDLESDTWNNDGAVGDVLLGHGNSYGDPAYPENARGGFLDNGSFLVIRKLKQDVAALNKRLPGDRAQRRQRLAKMMGRHQDGRPLVRHRNGDYNNFDFDKDQNGDKCPIHSHVRRMNPREFKPVVGEDRGGRIRVPRIVRRGMSYGETVTDDNLDADRGLMFMAYNASLAEQFEVLQRWLSGGNSSGGYSGQADPFMGVPEYGKKSTFRYVDGGKLIHQHMQDEKDPQPIVKLEWGLYLFVPSMRTLKSLTNPVGRPSLVERGEAIIKDLERLAAEQALGFPRKDHEVCVYQRWKAVLEDVQPSREEDLDAVWAAVRAKHGGVLRTPYGVLVGSERLVREVFADDGRRFSVRKYWWRLRKSFGDIYLSMDPRPKAFPGKDPSQPPRQQPYHKQVKYGDYQRRGEEVNALLHSFGEAWAFDPAYRYTSEKFGPEFPVGVQGNLRVRDLVHVVLGELSRDWFGIPNSREIHVGGEPTVDRPDTLHCPYHFISSSRYAFSPNPGPAAVDEGKDHGSRLQAATLKWVRRIKADPKKNPTPIGGELFRIMGDKPTQLASELIGAMHGFLPSTLGNLLKAIDMWSNDGNLWRIQEDYLNDGGVDPLTRANSAIRDPLLRALQYRPVPDQLHRIVVDRHVQLGREALEPGDTVVIGIGSASAELLEKGRADATWVFGGDYYGKNAGTHGCPGQKIAMGVMLGITAALLDAGQLRAEAPPLILTLMSRAEEVDQEV